MDKYTFLRNWINYNGKDLEVKKTQRWVCLHVGTGNELMVAYQLTKNKLPFFMPIYKGENNIFHSLFPSYLFTRIGSHSIGFVETLCKRILYVSFPNGERNLLSELQRFSEYYETREDYNIGDTVFIDPIEKKKLLIGKILAFEEISNDVIVNIPFFRRDTNVKISKTFISHTNISVDHKIFVPSGKEIISEKYISAIENATVKQPLNVILKNVNSELINFLRGKPDYLYHLDSRKYEELVAEILHDMGYDVHLTPQTRDGGRDIIAAIEIPPNRTIITFVECKKYSESTKIGIDIVERFLWVLKHKFDTNGGLIVTTSYYTEGARKVEQQYSQTLKLYDFNSMKIWLNSYGNWERSESGTIWIPKDKFVKSGLIH